MQIPVKIKAYLGTLKRALAVMAAVPVGLILIGSAIVPAVSAVGAQVQTRKIVMSDNRVGTAGGTNVRYDVYANVGSIHSLEGIVIDFCDGTNSPIIGTTCTKPTGLNLGTPTFTADTTTATAIDTTTWTAATINTGRTFALTTTTPVTTALTGANSLIHFTITGVTNPTPLSSNGTFYARILTYTSDSVALTYTDTDPKAYVDYGGFALSVTNPVSITARVQETLTYCVSGTDMSGVTTYDASATGTSCAAASTPAFVLGHGTDPTTYTIDNSEVDTAKAYTQISTNASQGAVVRMKNFNTCTNGGLSSNGGTVCNINGLVGTGTPSGSVASAMVPGTTAFGVFVSAGATTTGVTTSGGAYVPDANYNDGTHVTEPTASTVTVSSVSSIYYSPNPTLYYGDDQDVTSGVGTTYGDIVATTSGAPCSQMNNHIVFGVTAGLTVPAGIYTANIDFIATGTF
jgi:hypothetical protein